MKVVVFGDLNVDLLLRVDFIPTADIAVSAKELRIRHGGVGGNIAVALSRLGLKVRLLGAVGADIFGNQVVDELKNEGVDIAFIKHINVPTGIMVIFVVPSGARSIIGFRGANAKVNLSDHEISKALEGFNHIHLSGYMSLNDDGGQLLLNLARKAKARGLSVSIDLEGIATQKKSLVKEFRGLVDYVMLNKDEITYLSGTNDLNDSINYLDELLKPKAIFLKLGPKGSIVSFKGERQHINAFKIKAIDSTGAGDAFNAGVIYAILKGLDYVSAALVGNAMGAYACLGHGARYLPKSLNDLIKHFPEVRKVLKDV